MRISVILTLGFLTLITAEEEVKDGKIDSVVIESCGGWRLNKVDKSEFKICYITCLFFNLFKLPEVKAFINGEFQKEYLKTTYTKIPGIHHLKYLVYRENLRKTLFFLQ